MKHLWKTLLLLVNILLLHLEEELISNYSVYRISQNDSVLIYARIT